MNQSMVNKIWFARIDSNGWIDWIKNLIHGNKYGCFCLGILNKNNQIQRYNRWNNDVEYFYTADLE